MNINENKKQKKNETLKKNDAEFGVFRKISPFKLCVYKLQKKKIMMIIIVCDECVCDEIEFFFRL